MQIVEVVVFVLNSSFDRSPSPIIEYLTVVSFFKICRGNLPHVRMIEITETAEITVCITRRPLVLFWKITFYDEW